MQKYAIALVGILFVGVGVFLYIRNDNLVKNCTEETTAIVADMNQELSTDSDSTIYMYYPIIEYTTNEKPVRATMDRGSSTPEYNIGESITILYNPNKVDQFIVKGDKSSSIMSYVFMGIGVLLTGYGLFVAFKKN